MLTRDYLYTLPEKLIAQEPADPRDSSKLLIYNTKTNELKIDIFSQLATHLPPSLEIILNDAKVVPARVTLTKETGGKITILFLMNEWIVSPHGPIPCFLDRKAKVGDRLYFPDKSFVTVQKQDEGLFFVLWDGSVENIIQRLNSYGTMPIPLYIKHSPLSRDELSKKYQTIFAEKQGSSAAPTASLHFTPTVFQSLVNKGIKSAVITLHVGLGTFAPLTEKNLAENKLHAEWYDISQKAAEKIHSARNKNKEILAVGTTVTRTLESYAQQGVMGQKYSGSTELFIRPGYEFRVVDKMITNFHLPNSSLMMLVDAFLSYKKSSRRLVEIYNYAIEHEFRFYSFGDAMLIL